MILGLTRSRHNSQQYCCWCHTVRLQVGSLVLSAAFNRDVAIFRRTHRQGLDLCGNGLQNVRATTVRSSKSGKTKSSAVLPNQQSQLLRQMSELISLRERVAQAELTAHLYVAPAKFKAKGAGRKKLPR